MTEAFGGLQVLFEDDGLAGEHLPGRLESLYGGRLGLEVPGIYANFVSTLDGVAALPDVKDSPAVISGNHEGDRLVMGLLRSFADAIVIGASTMRDAEGHQWTAEYILPELKDDFARLRSQLGKSPEPTLVVVSGRGNVPADHPVLGTAPIFLSTSDGAPQLRKRLPSGSRIEPLGSGDRIAPPDLKAFLDSEGFGSVLSEAGPTLFGELLKARLIKELFLTLSPLIGGRAQDGRPGIVNRVEFLPNEILSGRLVSLRRSESHLFLRYRTYHSL